MLGVFVVPIALGGTAGASLGTPPTQGMKVPTSIGKGEGKLNIIAWEGYTQPEWVKPFENTTGCTGQRQVRRILQRDGVAHGQRRRPPVGPRLRVR